MYFDQIAFGKRLKEQRGKKNMSQEEVAEKLNVSANHYGHMEQGRKGCSIDMLLELADLFQVSTDYLLRGRSADKETEAARIEDAISILSEVLHEM